MVRLELAKQTERSETEHRNFNSIMVRLERKGYHVMIDDFKFQFHYGAIGTFSFLTVPNYLLSISIPLWCDWNH